MESTPTLPAPAVKPKPLRKGYPPDFAGWPPLKRIEWLNGEDCAGLVAQGLINDLDVFQRKTKAEAQRSRHAKKLPSVRWRDDIERGAQYPPGGIVARGAAPAHEPDPPYQPMVRADIVLCDDELDVYWPANYLSARAMPWPATEKARTRKSPPLHGNAHLKAPERRAAVVFATFDMVCAETDRLRAEMESESNRESLLSPSAKALERLQNRQERIQEAKLKPEGRRSLEAMIARFLAGDMTVLDGMVDEGHRRRVKKYREIQS
jgi:hypothetical protein